MATTFALAPQNEIARALDSGESLIWSGTPRQGILLRPSDGYMIPFSLLWGGFVIFWEANVLRIDGPNAWFMSIWGIPFVLIGLYMIVGRFLVDARSRANTFYGLTNRRAIIISGLFSRTINSLPLRTLSDISLQERSDRSGTILLGRPLPYSSWGSGMRWPGLSQYSTPAFEMIPDAKAVHERGPHWADPLKAWGDVLAKQGKTKHALAKYDEALKYAPHWKQLKEAREGLANQKT